uniref:Uncharacterized protein n=1 Tax=Arundo donax TaxID=35708 RepID=A0A0A9CI10_ARUDO
MDLNNLVDGE